MIREEAAFYKTGGTLAPNEPSYISREADDDLYLRLREGKFCYVLTSRQMGKSSLMNRTATRLHREGTVVAELDLTGIGQNLTLEQWYDGLVYEIGRRLNLKAQLKACWQANARLGPLHRFLTTLRDGVLTSFFQPVIIFIDEIEVVRSLPFNTDEFFAAIRECYNRRATDPEMQRLTFCLFGMATPQELIRDTRITPFNIGKRIELTDFTEQEAGALARGLQGPARNGIKLLRRVLYWTSGQPYLTQRLCQEVSQDPGVTNDAGVDRVCHRLFLSEQARESEANLVPMREYLLRNAPDKAAMLDLYKKTLQGKRVAADLDNPIIEILQLSGITRAQKGRLQIRNRIYAGVFDKAWIRVNMPNAEMRRQRAAAVRAIAQTTAVLGTIIAVVAGLAWVAWKQAGIADREAVRATSKNNKHAFFFTRPT